MSRGVGKDGVSGRVAWLIANKEPRELRRLAPRAWADGSYGHALDLYEALARVEPRNPMHRLRIGDCLSRLSKRVEARDAYLRAADEFAAAGMISHAAATLRVVLRADPQDLDVLARVAELQRRRADAVDPLAAFARAPAPDAELEPPVIRGSLPALPREVTREFSVVEIELSALEEVTPVPAAPASAASAVIARLQDTIAALSGELAQREGEIARQRATIAELQARVHSLADTVAMRELDAVLQLSAAAPANAEPV